MSKTNIPVMRETPVRIVPTGTGETIAEMCACMAGSGPTQTTLASSAKPPAIYAPRRPVSLRLIALAIAIGIIATLIAAAVLA